MSATLDPADVAWLDQEDRRTAATIRRYGVSLQYVGGEPDAEIPPFAYTIGLFGLGHPEVLAVGLDSGTAGHLLNAVADLVREGRDLVPGEILAFEGWSHRVTVEPVPNPGEIAFGANRFYQRPSEVSVPLLQLTYDDREGRFPWDVGYSRPRWVQPRPGAFRA